MVEGIAVKTVDSLNIVLQSKLYSQLGSLFLTESCYWEDHLGLTNTQFVILSGIDSIVCFIVQHPRITEEERWKVVLEQSIDGAIVRSKKDVSEIPTSFS